MYTAGPEQGFDPPHVIRFSLPLRQTQDYLDAARESDRHDACVLGVDYDRVVDTFSAHEDGLMLLTGLMVEILEHYGLMMK